MEWIKQGLLALAIGLPAVVALMVVMTASRVTRLRLRRSSVAMAARNNVPAPVRATLDKAKPFLEGLGFQYRYTTSSEHSVATPDGTPLFTDVYQHADGNAHASASPSMTPEQGQPCTVMWATLMQSGKVIATANCYLHNLVSAPAGWKMHDDYLPDPSEAWESHRRRVSSAKDAIVTDGVEFFRATKFATEQLMAHGEKKGLLVRDGDEWRMPWRAALPFAWKLFLGQRKVAKVRSAARFAAAAAPAAPHGLEADVEAFQQQLAVQRATRWSGQKKFKAFLVTAALFLGVGSLWVSWTFLPILLAVIGLHEGGHYLAMKISGYRNLSVFFVPGLGGLATGEKASASPWEKLFVYLAGPMPGIALAVAGLIGQMTGTFQPPPWFQEFLIACLVINYLNLLPITPLDGGRVVETFLFARLPVARFLFALLGLAAFVAFGLATSDNVMLILAVFVGLSLPHQWRVMRVDRAIARHGSETLDERGAIERVFTALQHPRFAAWPFATRAAAATALLPELQGRRAGALEAVGGIAIYLACLLAPPITAMLAVPQLAAIGAAVRQGYNMVPDDVDAEPLAAPAQQRDWYAEAAQVQSLPESQRLAVLLGAADFAAGVDEQQKVQGFLSAAWEIAEKRPAHDYDRARTLMAMAREHKEPARRAQWFKQVAADLEGVPDKQSLLLVAEAKEHLSWDAAATGTERVELLRQVVAHREAALLEGAPELAAARLSLAMALEDEGVPDEAEALLRRNVDGIPMPPATDRSRQGLTRRTQRVQAQVELAWLLNAHGRSKEAGNLMDRAAAQVPAKISVSWEHPHRMVREAHLWATLQHGDPQSLKDSWRKYEESRSGVPNAGVPALRHEVDRFVVAQRAGDEALKAQALASIAEAVKTPQAKFARASLCEERAAARGWRTKQGLARTEAAAAAGVCAK